jgi:hypothetical protein
MARYAPVPGRMAGRLSSWRGYLEPEEQIITRQIIIVDKQNRARIQIGCSTKEDLPVINMLDEDNNDRLSLCLSGTGKPIINLLSPDKKHLASLAVNEKEGVSLSLNDDAGKLRLSVSVNKDDRPSIILRDGDGHIRLSAFVNSRTNMPILLLVPPDGDIEKGVEISLSPDGRPGIFGVDSESNKQFEIL